MKELNRICSWCKTPKPIDDFGFRERVRHKICKACCSKAVRQTYRQSLQYRESCKQRKILRRLENHKRIYAYLKEHGCADCPERNPLVLQFDHRKGDKFGCVPGLVHCSWERILKEIAKCTVRCVRCHMIKTAREENTIRWQLSQEDSHF